MSPNTPASGTPRDNNPETSLYNMLGKPLTGNEISTTLGEHHSIPHSLIGIPEITPTAIEKIMGFKIPSNILPH